MAGPTQLYLIINIALAALIPKCNGIQEKEYKNSLEKTSGDKYISVDLSTWQDTVKFNIISSTINGINSKIFITKEGLEIGEVLDNGSPIWQGINQKLVLGTIFTKENADVVLLSLAYRGENGIEYALFQNINQIYRQIDSFRFADVLMQLASWESRIYFKMDLHKHEIPQIVDKTVMIEDHKLSLFIPEVPFVANKVSFIDDILLDGTKTQEHCPIAIGYQSEEKTYVNMLIVKEKEVMGRICKYEYIQENFKLIKCSENKQIYQAFTHDIGTISDPITTTEKINGKRSTLKRLASQVENKKTEELKIPIITLDILNPESQFVRIEEHIILSNQTIKIIPVSAIINKVVLGQKKVWSSTKEEIKAKQVVIHSISNLWKIIELSIITADGKIITKSVRYDSLMEEEEREQEINTNVNPEQDRKSPSTALEIEDLYDAFERERTQNERKKGTPPNSPAKMTPPNSPARTRKTTPAVSRSNSTSLEDSYPYPGEDINQDLLREYDEVIPEEEEEMIYRGPRRNAIFEDTFALTSFKGVEEETSAEETEKHTPNYRVEEIIESEPEEEKNQAAGAVLDLSREESFKSVVVVDGRRFVPFIFLFPTEGNPITEIKDKDQKIWIKQKQTVVLKSVSVYYRAGRPKALALWVFDGPLFYNKYYLNEAGRWLEIPTEDYIKNTEYEFRKIEKKETTKTETKRVKDEVWKVSLMVPVVLGILFLVAWLASMVFVIFYL